MILVRWSPSNKVSNNRDYTYRYFVSDRAFPKNKRKALRRTSISCNTPKLKKGKSHELQTNDLNKNVRFMQSREHPGARTFQTYEPNRRTGGFYVSANTNSVFHGGLVRSVLPTDGVLESELSLEVRGYTNHCDSNAFFLPKLPNKKFDWDEFRNVRGLQWAYGQVRLNGYRTGIMGWIPMPFVGPDASGKQSKFKIRTAGKSCLDNIDE